MSTIRYLAAAAIAAASLSAQPAAAKLAAG